MKFLRVNDVWVPSDDSATINDPRVTYFQTLELVFLRNPLQKEKLLFVLYLM